MKYYNTNIIYAAASDVLAFCLKYYILIMV